MITRPIRAPEADDAVKLHALGVELLYAPDVAEMYPAEFASTIRVGGLTEGLCGAHRPGHFEGVATVVAKLLIQCMPDVAFFGEKDYQQLQVIKRLVRDLNIPVRIEGVPTVREADGLACSSRNAHLSDAERRLAPALYRVLTTIVERLELAAGAPREELAWGPGRASAVRVHARRLPGAVRRGDACAHRHSRRSGPDSGSRVAWRDQTYRQPRRRAPTSGCRVRRGVQNYIPQPRRRGRVTLSRSRVDARIPQPARRSEFLSRLEVFAELPGDGPLITDRRYGKSMLHHGELDV